MIPKIIHQSWKTTELPVTLRKYHESWIKHHPDFEIRLHTDDDNLRLVRDHYPSFLSVYENFRYTIQRVDLARLLHLHHSGGVYADLDLECLKPIDLLLSGKDFVLVKEPESSAMGKAPFLVANYFIAASKQCSFLANVIERICTYTMPYPHANMIAHVLATTGTYMLTQVYNDYLPHANHNLLSSQLFSPQSLREAMTPKQTPPMMIAGQPYGIHHFHASWH